MKSVISGNQFEVHITYSNRKNWDSIEIYEPSEFTGSGFKFDQEIADQLETNKDNPSKIDEIILANYQGKKGYKR